MVNVRISCHDDLYDLQYRSNDVMVVELRSLESVRIASDSFALLRSLIERESVRHRLDLGYWRCPQMDLLSRVAGVALELHKIKHDLYPLLVVQEAKLEEGFLNALVLLKNSAVALVHLAKGTKEKLELCVGLLDEEEDELLRKELVERCSLDEEDDDVLLGKVSEKVEKVGKELNDTADLVLKGTHNIAWLQLRLPSVLDAVDVLLSTPVLFPHVY